MNRRGIKVISKKEVDDFGKLVKQREDSAEAKFTEEFAKWVNENFPPKKDGK